MSQRLGIPAEELMYVGDHPINDIDGSRNAGYTPVWVKTTGYWCFEEIPRAEYEVETVAEIPDLVAQINRK
jgi:putative hydrolase of the HAD superfamily